MQVNQISDSITHAVIGNQKSVEMGVSDSAALMHIFSTALYTYPKLATVREIMCNAWDAHISAGKTDKPIDVTLTPTHLTIRDYGFGIHDDKIGPIYGMFGDSTKRDDSTVTGGFGLGSKAPFAYVDNFEVISCHEGMKTVYNMSKSSMEVGGKPSIKRIISVPTDETGISVKIALKDGAYQEFEKLVREVRTLGEIPMNLNGVYQDDILPLLASPTGYIISSFRGTNSSAINLRYGNVVYPIPMHDSYKDEYDIVHRIIRGLWASANIIFIAPPNMVTIAPSRESLILTDGTVETIKQMLSKFDPRTADKAEESCEQMVRENLNKAVRRQTCLSTYMGGIYPTPLKQIGNIHTSGAYAYTAKRAALHYMVANRAPKVDDEEIMLKKLNELIRLKFVDIKMAKAIRRKASTWHKPKSDYTARDRSFIGILQRYVTSKVHTAIDANEKMNRDRFFYADVTDYGNVTFTKPKDQRYYGIVHAMAYLQRKVLMVRSQKGAEEFFKSLKRTSVDSDRAHYGWFVYLCPAHEKSHDTIEGVFKELGYTVTKNIPKREVYLSDPKAFIGPLMPKAVVVKRKGYPTITQSLAEGDDGIWYFTLGNARKVCTPGTEIKDPIAWVELYPKGFRAKHFAGFSENESHLIHKLWGDQIACVIPSQVAALIERGIPSVSEYIIKHADTTLSAKQDLRRYLAYAKPIEENLGGDTAKIARQMVKHKTLMDLVGLRFHISAETELLLTFFNGNYSNQMPLCQALAQKVKPSPKYKEITQKMNESPYKDYLNLRVLSRNLELLLPDSPKALVPYELVQHLLK